MTALRRSVLFERNSKAASNEIKQDSSSNQSVNRSGVFATNTPDAADSSPKPSLLSLAFVAEAMERALWSRF
jgi:hypothetical protein